MGIKKIQKQRDIHKSYFLSFGLAYKNKAPNKINCQINKNDTFRKSTSDEYNSDIINPAKKIAPTRHR